MTQPDGPAQKKEGREPGGAGHCWLHFVLSGLPWQLAPSPAELGSAKRASRLLMRPAASMPACLGCFAVCFMTLPGRSQGVQALLDSRRERGCPGGTGLRHPSSGQQLARCPLADAVCTRPIQGVESANHDPQLGAGRDESARSGGAGSVPARRRRCHHPAEGKPKGPAGPVTRQHASTNP